MEGKRRRLGYFLPGVSLTESDSQKWGPLELARIRAFHTTEITPETEPLVRTHHPALRDHAQVHVSHPQYGPEVWLVQEKCSDIEAGGRPIHYYPGEPTHLISSTIIVRSPWKEEFLFKDGINPRKLLSYEQLDSLRELFPTAIGARVLVTGFIIILFKSPSDIQDAYKHYGVIEIGGLRTIYDELRLEASADTVVSGMEVSDQPNNIHGLGCLGLRIRMTDGKEAITTVTHGFVRHPQGSRVVNILGDWYLRTKSALQQFFRPPPQSETCAIGVVRNLGNSPIGKEVWLTNVKKRIGRITETFDKPSPILPYPMGYKHDISLITDKDLPLLVSPPGYPVVLGWADYSAALAGSRVYAVRMHTLVGRWKSLEGTIDPNAIRDATVVGAQYLWDHTTHSQNASLLWKTTEPSTPAQGWSGSVLCLGRPTDESSKAILFQNFEVWCLSYTNPLTGIKPIIAVKGGFLLPESVRSSMIVTGNEQHRERNPDTYPRRSRENTDPGRRVFSDV
ncbi:hypothetical protein ARAM_003766 [Aspergillus rambellii]|uniref:Uncharacterized protein n=2 Tax=Aspergillus subgen. Nidulantes TaxID=2720870 RepID=A0A0F8UYX7_9EURO|nr:hypothetical protein AOCH_002995 [Aspergillus ochraceoroseus]KKK24698.1 hypothetical protein ARAM_003766 [Aspergillus rambellii]